MTNKTHIQMESPCCPGTNLYLRVGIDQFNVQTGEFDIETSTDMTLICECGWENVDWDQMINFNRKRIAECQN